MRFYANENFPRRTVEALRSLGHDVLTSAEAGNAHRAVPDEEVLSFASAEGRAVLTHNRADFFRLARSTPVHAGIVACTFDPDFARQAALIHAALPSDLAGKVLRIIRPSQTDSAVDFVAT